MSCMISRIVIIRSGRLKSHDPLLFDDLDGFEMRDRDLSQYDEQEG